jgi:hypothetical protein
MWLRAAAAYLMKHAAATALVIPNEWTDELLGRGIDSPGRAFWGLVGSGLLMMITWVPLLARVPGALRA